MTIDISTHVTVVGAGGIGASIAVGLALAGEDVAVVDSSTAHVSAIRERGLRVDGIRGDHTVQLKALLPSEIADPLGIVLLCVKSQDTASALDSLIPYLDRDSVVVSLQNGWNPRDIAARIGQDRTLGAMVHMVGNHNGPGYVTRFTTGDLYIGELGRKLTSRVTDLAERLSAAVPTHATDNVWGYIWSKQIYGTTMPANALVDLPAREIVQHDWVKTVLLALILEAMDVARAEGVQLEAYERLDPARMELHSREDVPEAMEMLPKGSAKGNSGVWYDIKVRHKKTEVDYLSGEIVRIGRRRGLAMELNGLVVEMIHEIESGRREMSWENLRRLERPAGEFVENYLRREAAPAGH